MQLYIIILTMLLGLLNFLMGILRLRCLLHWLWENLLTLSFAMGSLHLRCLLRWMRENLLVTCWRWLPVWQLLLMRMRWSQLVSWMRVKVTYMVMLQDVKIHSQTLLVEEMILGPWTDRKGVRDCDVRLDPLWLKFVLGVHVCVCVCACACVCVCLCARVCVCVWVGEHLFAKV